ncbi:MAG TPA: large conductance mechanosensitive channel protein MscL [Acidimicrobiia bacterium]|nr:large conductance mechanosensitive channel protein MscL [Acidimicrobiia bacterium]
MFKEFKEFAMKPTLIEIAVGLVMAVALGSLVSSLVDHVVMPIAGILFGEPSFDSALVLTINDSRILFGSFLSSVVSFLSVAAAVFFFIIKPYKAFLARKEAPAEEPAAEPEDLVLLREIRDALQAR